MPSIKHFHQTLLTHYKERLLKVTLLSSEWRLVRDAIEYHSLALR